MRTRRGLGVGVLVGTGLLLAATVGLASLPPRPLRSALTVLHTLTFRVATDWLAVVALLAVAGRFVRTDERVSWRTVAALTAAVFLGGVAVEASPLARLAAASGPVDLAPLVEEVGLAVRHALYPAGFFLAVVVGGVTVRRGSGPARGTRRALPLASTRGRVPNLSARAVTRVLVILAAVTAVSFTVDLGARLAVGVPYPWLAVVEAGVAAVGAGVGYAVLAGAFLGLAVEGVGPRSLAGTTAVVWVVLALAGVFGGIVTAGLGVALVGVAGVPMPAVDAAGLGRWPAPHSWATLLRLGTLVAGGVGLLAVQRTAESRSTVRDTSAESPGRAERDPGGSGTGTATDASTGARTGLGASSGSGDAGGSERR